MNKEATSSKERFQDLDKDKIDIEPSGFPVSQEDMSFSGKRANDSAFSRLSRELSEEDLNASGTKKMILNLVDSLTTDNYRLKKMELQYYSTEKQYAVLQEKFDNLRININIKNILSMCGSGLLGLLPTLVARKWDIWSIIVIGFFALVMALLPYIVLTLSWKTGGKPQ